MPARVGLQKSAFLRSLKIGARLALGFGITLVLICLVGGLGALRSPE
jgi:hypothetical protein